jgi:hypothetical protein
VIRAAARLGALGADPSDPAELQAGEPLGSWT